MDYALLTFLLTLGTLIATFLFRKRILRALGRLLFAESVKFVRGTYFEEVEEETDDGPKRVLRPSPALQSLSASVVPMLVQTAVKSIKLKPGGTGVLPPGLDLSNLSEALPALLSSGMVPKKYAAIVALAAPFLQGVLGGGAKPKGGESPSKPPPGHPLHK